MASHFFMVFCIAGLPPSDLSIHKMILTQCCRLRHRAWLVIGARNAAAAARATVGPNARCSTGKRAATTALQENKKAGGAEQYNANKKYAEAVTVAVEKCAEDTKGQTCYICTQALHWKTKEGLVRGCSCRGTAGFAHVSCLAEQAKILIAEAEENNLDDKVKNERWQRWHTCSLCEQMYHGVVRCALGWACWKTYVGRPEGDQARCLAMTRAWERFIRCRATTRTRCPCKRPSWLCCGALAHQKKNILAVQGNLANTYGRSDGMKRPYQMSARRILRTLRLHGEEHPKTLRYQPTTTRRPPMI